MKPRGADPLVRAGPPGPALRGPAPSSETRDQGVPRGPGGPPHRAVFFDRDGTLMEEVHYCSDPALVRVYPGVPQALRQLKAAGFRTFIVTNQSGIGRGRFTEAQYRAVEEEFLRQLGPGAVDATYFCPDVPGLPSTHRKPAPGMVLEAAADFALDLPNSFFIGDKADDIECGHRAGTRTILVLTGYGASQNCPADFTARDALEAISMILVDFC